LLKLATATKTNDARVYIVCAWERFCIISGASDYVGGRLTYTATRLCESSYQALIVESIKIQKCIT